MHQELRSNMFKIPHNQCHKNIQLTWIPNSTNMKLQSRWIIILDQKNQLPHLNGSGDVTRSLSSEFQLNKEGNDFIFQTWF